MINSGTLQSYSAVISARYRTLLQYRAAAIAGFITQLFWGALRIMIFTAFYTASVGEQPMSLAQVITYVWLGQALLVLLPWNIDKEIAALIHSGDVAYELVRPLDLYAYWFCRTIALRTAPTLLRAIPMVIFAMIVLPLLGLGDWALSLPASPASFALFLISLVGAVLIGSATTMLMHGILVLTISGDGINRILPAFINILSGMVVPLPLFPSFLQPFLEWQPFRGIMDVPFRIYNGDIAPAVAWLDISQQFAWAIILILLGRWQLKYCIKRVVAQGG